MLQSTKRIPALLNLNRLLWLAVFVGIFLRFVHYLLNRSLWIDEAFVALNILNKSWGELIKPLDYNQGAPVGFLWGEKFFVQLLGTSEYALRLFPFLAGIIAIFLFYRVAKWLSPLPVVVIAIGLFALCDRPIYYSAEIKQYSSDITVALLIYLMAIQLRSPRLNWFQVVLFGFLGAILIWFSHPSVFVLGGTGMTLLVIAFIQKEWSKIYKYLVVFLAWLLSFLAFYQVSLQQLGSNETLQKSWDANHDSFMPFPPLNFNDLRWYGDKLIEIFNYPVGLYLKGIAILCFTVGCLIIFRKNKEKFFLLLSPILLTLLASGINKYPFKGQLLLFIIPSMLLIIAEGAYWIYEKTRSQAKIVGIAIILLLFFHPVYYAAWNLKAPQFAPHFEYQRIREDLKPVLNYVRENHQDEDVLYLYYASQYAFKYYANRYGFDYEQYGEPVWSEPPEDWFFPAIASYPPKLIVGKYSREDWSVFEQELEQLKGNQRVWIIFSHVRDRRSSLDEEKIFLYLLDRIGERLDSFKSIEASTYLYNLSQPPV